MKTGLRFGLTAVLGAFIGVQLLFLFSDLSPLYNYDISGKSFSITIFKLIIAMLMIIFALFEVVPYLKNIQFEKDKLYFRRFIKRFFLEDFQVKHSRIIINPAVL